MLTEIYLPGDIIECVCKDDGSVTWIDVEDVCLSVGMMEMLHGYSHQTETVLEAILCPSLQYEQVTRLFDIVPGLDTCHYDHTTGVSVCLISYLD